MSTPVFLDEISPLDHCRDLLHGDVTDSTDYCAAARFILLSGLDLNGPEREQMQRAAGHVDSLKSRGENFAAYTHLRELLQRRHLELGL